MDQTLQVLILKATSAAPAAPRTAERSSAGQCSRLRESEPALSYSSPPVSLMCGLRTPCAEQRELGKQPLRRYMLSNATAYPSAVWCCRDPLRVFQYTGTHSFVSQVLQVQLARRSSGRRASFPFLDSTTHLVIASTRRHSPTECTYTLEHFYRATAAPLLHYSVTQHPPARSPNNGRGSLLARFCITLAPILSVTIIGLHFSPLGLAPPLCGHPCLDFAPLVALCHFSAPNIALQRVEGTRTGCTMRVEYAGC